MHEVVAEIAGVQLTVRAAGGIIAACILLLFAWLFIAGRRRTTAGDGRKGDWLNALGYGLLPAMAVCKIFEEPDLTGAGATVAVPLPEIGWLTESGRYVPCRVELAAALLCFTGVTLWLMLRKRRLEEKGELLLVSLCLWSGVRIVTESLWEAPRALFRYGYCGVLLACLLVWTLRRNRKSPSVRRCVMDWAVAAVCTGIIVVTAEGIYSVGSPIGNLAAITGCAVLLTLTAMLCGSDARGDQAPEP